MKPLNIALSAVLGAGLLVGSAMLIDISTAQVNEVALKTPPQPQPVAAKVRLNKVTVVIHAPTIDISGNRVGRASAGISVADPVLTSAQRQTLRAAARIVLEIKDVINPE